jgi:hypothetical protein
LHSKKPLPGFGKGLFLTSRNEKSPQRSRYGVKQSSALLSDRAEAEMKKTHQITDGLFSV